MNKIHIYLILTDESITEDQKICQLVELGFNYESAYFVARDQEYLESLKALYDQEGQEVVVFRA